MGPAIWIRMLIHTALQPQSRLWIVILEEGSKNYRACTNHLRGNSHKWSAHQFYICTGKQIATKPKSQPYYWAFKLIALSRLQLTTNIKYCRLILIMIYEHSRLSSYILNTSTLLSIIYIIKIYILEKSILPFTIFYVSKLYIRILIL